MIASLFVTNVFEAIIVWRDGVLKALEKGAPIKPLSSVIVRMFPDGIILPDGLIAYTDALQSQIVTDCQAELTARQIIPVVFFDRVPEKSDES